eukprot:gene19008-25593_t
MNIEGDIPCGCNGIPTGLSTRFEGNVAFTGGAITSLGYKSHTVLMNVFITNNTALGATPANVPRMETMTNINYTDDISAYLSFEGGCGLGGGGGMCFSCGEGRLQRKCLGSISGTIFQANSADYGGGLYITADEKACGDPDEFYTIHITRIIQTFPTPKHSPFSPISPISPNWTTILSFHYQHLVGGDSYQFTSGDDLQFNISLTDFWGRQYVPSVLSAKAMLTLTFSDQANRSSTQKEATTLPLQVWRSMETTFSFMALPGPHSVIVTPAPSALGRYFQPFVLNIDVLPCKLEEYDPEWDAGYRCVLCDVGSYRVDEDLTECKPNADNPIIVPDTGYFHSNPFSTQLYQCDEQALVTPCAYSGRYDRIVEYQLTLLNDTSKAQQIGEKRSGAQEAEQCTPPQPAHQTLERAQRIGSRINRTQEAGFITLAATWKIFVTYLQSLLMMRWIQKNNSLLPSSFSKLLGGVQAIFSTTTFFLSKECAISGKYVLDRRVLMTIIAATFPLMVYVVISLYYLVFPIFHRLLALLMRRTSSDPISTQSAPFKWPDYATKMITSALVVLFYYYPTWIQVFLEMFLCYTINFEDSAEETQLARVSGLHYGPRWSFNFDLQCYEEQHAVLVYTMGIAGLIFIVSTPIVMAWHLFANAYQLDSSRFRMKFGFLYEEYHHRCYAWESVILLRKLVFASSLMFLSSPYIPVGAQILTALAITSLGFAAHVFTRPYVSDYVHNMEFLSQVSIFIILFLRYNARSGTPPGPMGLVGYNRQPPGSLGTVGYIGDPPGPMGPVGYNGQPPGSLGPVG